MPNEEKRRVNLSLSIGEELKEYLKSLQEDLTFEDGKQYPLSYLIEDMIIWIITDDKRLDQFIEDNYIVEEDEEDD